MDARTQAERLATATQAERQQTAADVDALAEAGLVEVESPEQRAERERMEAELSDPMPALVPKPHPGTLIRDCPALTDRGWLPDDFDPLEPLRDEHLQLLDRRSEASEALREQERAFEAEDAERQEAMKTAYRTGADPDDVAPVTPPEEREAFLEPLRERLRAAQAALTEFLSEAVDEITEGAPGWLGELAEQSAEAQALREEAAKLLAEAEALEGPTRKLRRWIARQGGLDSFARSWEVRCMAYSQLPEPPDPEAGKTIELEELRGSRLGIPPHAA